MDSPNVPQQANSAAPRPTNGTAIAALVLSILFAPLGIVLAYIARSQIERTGDGGRGFVTAALIIGWVLTLGWVLIPMVVATIVMFTAGS